ncbi:MAG: tRNA epoxyqueuosine(34) reductase QueG [Armatimonadota bacterium]
MKSIITTAQILARAKELGFAAAGIVAAEPMDPAPLREWLAAGYGAEMHYLQRHLPLRGNLEAVLPGARSVICMALSYSGLHRGEHSVGAVAGYAQSTDYHDVVHGMLKMLWDQIHSQHPNEQGRIFVDGGPLPERELARRAGIGWVGKHSCLIAPGLGSQFVLGEILTTLPLEPTLPQTGSCGSCRRCLDACPTGALVAPRIDDARRCLSYLTIEHKGPIPREIRPLLGGRVFGCDTCQAACPYNSGVGEETLPLTLDLLDLLAITDGEFRHRFRGTALNRAKRRGLLRNACVVLGNLRDPTALPALRSALADAEPLVRGHAAWALGQYGEENALRERRGIEDNPYVVTEIDAALLRETC